MSEAAQEAPLAAAPDPPAEPDPEPATAKQATAYLVLSKDADKDWWIKVGSYTAASAKAAISAHVKANDAKAGTFVAVPERSWKPLTLLVETQTKIALT